MGDTPQGPPGSGAAPRTQAGVGGPESRERPRLESPSLLALLVGGDFGWQPPNTHPTVRSQPVSPAQAVTASAEAPRLKSPGDNPASASPAPRWGQANRRARPQDAVGTAHSTLNGPGREGKCGAPERKGLIPRQGLAQALTGRPANGGGGRAAHLHLPGATRPLLPQGVPGGTGAPCQQAGPRPTLPVCKALTAKDDVCRPRRGATPGVPALLCGGALLLLTLADYSGTCYVRVL